MEMASKNERVSRIMIVVGIGTVFGSMALVALHARSLRTVSSQRSGAIEGNPPPVPEVHV